MSRVRLATLWPAWRFRSNEAVAVNLVMEQEAQSPQEIISQEELLFSSRPSSVAIEDARESLNEKFYQLGLKRILP